MGLSCSWKWVPSIACEWNGLGDNKGSLEVNDDNKSSDKVLTTMRTSIMQYDNTEVIELLYTINVSCALVYCMHSTNPDRLAS